jgi:hypothetical protein
MNTDLVHLTRRLLGVIIKLLYVILVLLGCRLGSLCRAYGAPLQVPREQAYALVLSHLVGMVGPMTWLHRLRAAALRPAARRVTGARAGPGS